MLFFFFLLCSNFFEFLAIGLFAQYRAGGGGRRTSFVIRDQHEDRSVVVLSTKLQFS